MLFADGFTTGNIALRIVGLVAAVAVLVFGAYLLLRPDKNAKKAKK